MCVYELERILYGERLSNEQSVFSMTPEDLRLHSHIVQQLHVDLHGS